MITTGEEGFRTEGDPTVDHSWLNTGEMGSNFACHVNQTTIDVSNNTCNWLAEHQAHAVLMLPIPFCSVCMQFATIHPYPDSWGFDGPDEWKWFGPNFLEDRAKVAHSLNKPIALTEYGARRCEQQHLARSIAPHCARPCSCSAFSLVAHCCTLQHTCRHANLSLRTCTSLPTKTTLHAR